MGFIGKERGHIEEQIIAWDKIRDIKTRLIPIKIEWRVAEDGYSRPSFTMEGKPYPNKMLDKG